MGIPSFHVAASLTMVTAQRLIRRLCDHCKVPLSKQEAKSLQSQLPPHQPNTLFKAFGCQACDKGYKGRIGLFQVMPISAEMQALILRDAPTQALSAQAAQEGVRSLRQAGWLKMRQGVTSMAEVKALTPHA
jgi:type IV pilus assembly protein PilB